MAHFSRAEVTLNLGILGEVDVSATYRFIPAAEHPSGKSEVEVQRIYVQPDHRLVDISGLCYGPATEEIRLICLELEGVDVTPAGLKPAPTVEPPGADADALLGELAGPGAGLTD